jgi:dolichol-phosphate mannosyltransferase
MIDDGSKDGTLTALRRFKDEYPEKVTIVKLSGNFGSYNAIQAGMAYATGDCNIVITADLQDPPELMQKMYEYWKQGIKLVIANRTEREDGFLSRSLASFYQKLMKRYALPGLPPGGFDYCLFDAQLRKQVVEMKENHTNSLYLLLWLKYDFVSIPYKRTKRQAGKSSWTLAKRIKLFIDSFVSFSFAPLRLISAGGLLLGFIALLYAIYIALIKIIGITKVEGWTTMMVVFLLVAAFQMISIGILGEYLWRSLEAGRKRPVYIVDNVSKASDSNLPE